MSPEIGRFGLLGWVGVVSDCDAGAEMSLAYLLPEGVECVWDVSPIRVSLPPTFCRELRSNSLLRQRAADE